MSLNIHVGVFRINIKTISSLLILCLLFTSTVFAVAGGEQPSARDKAGWERLANLGSGFVVWESNLSPNGDQWRMMYRNLDGSDFRQLSPDEPSRDHCGAAVSPDGKWVAYLSIPSGTGYNDYRDKSPIHIVRSMGGGDRVVVEDGRRMLGGNRAAIWTDNTRLNFLDPENIARSIDIVSGKISEPLITNERGFLPDPTAKYAFNQVRIFAYDANGRKVIPRGPVLKGCEPLFTQDGCWSVRMSRAGGPIDRIDPSNYSLTPLVTPDDKRLPKGRRYVYFPNVSPDGNLMAWGASPNQHDHHRSDYEIYVAAVNPATLMLKGDPVRYSFSSRTDRYPVPFLNDTPLGRFSGKVPLTVVLTTPSKTVANWRSGDSATGRGLSFIHTYRNPGEYRLVAEIEGREMSARVTVLPTSSPLVGQTMLSQKDSIVFSWSADGNPAVVRNEDGKLESVVMNGRGLASLDRNNGMELTGGNYLFPNSGPQIGKALRATHAMTIEVVIRAADATQGGPARILTLSRDTQNRNFTLGQEQGAYILRLRTPSTGANGISPETTFGAVDISREQHIVCTYSNNEIACYLDGREVLRKNNTVAGDFSNWEDMDFMVGDELTNGRCWMGRIQAIVIYDRALSADEVAASFQNLTKSLVD